MTAASTPIRTSRSRRGPHSRNPSRPQVNQLLGLVYALLALAVLIALIGIVNTLMLSVFERTHEIGLLRAVGMKRRQVRAMIRSESVIIAVFGAIIGIVVGTALGTAFAASLKQQGITDIVYSGVKPGGLPRPRGPTRLGGRQLAGPPSSQVGRPGGHRHGLTLYLVADVEVQRTGMRAIASDLGRCSGGETRTLNLAVNSRLLCRLSYPGI